MIKKRWIFLIALMWNTDAMMGMDQTTFTPVATPTQISPPIFVNSLTISALPAYNWLKYGINNVRSSGGFDIGFGLTFRTQLSRNLQLAIGVNYRNYSGFIDINGIRDSARFIEPSEGHPYLLHKIFKSTEEQTVRYVEPNIRLEYVRRLTPVIDFIAGIGVGFGFHMSESNQMTGSYRRFADFYESFRVIEDPDFPILNLGTHTEFINPSQNNIFGFSPFALGQVGFKFNLSPRWQLLTMLNVQYGFPRTFTQQDALIRNNSYSGIAASDISGGVHAFSAGLEIGVSWRFGERTRGCP